MCAAACHNGNKKNRPSSQGAVFLFDSLNLSSLQRLVAFFPAALDQAAVLQAVQDTQNFFNIAADAEVVHRHVADNAFRVNDEGRAQAYAGTFMQNAKSVRQFVLDVGEHREWQVVQVLVALAPVEVNIVAVRAHAEHLRVARRKFLVQLAEGRDFGRADEGEVLRPGEENSPLALVAGVGDVLLEVVVIAGNNADELEFWKLMTYC